MKIDSSHPLAARATSNVKRAPQQADAFEPMPIELFPITFVLPYPPSVNKIYAPIVIKGRAQLMKTKDHAEYMGAVGNAVRCAQLTNPLIDRYLELNQFPFTGPVSVTIEIFRPLKSGDLDNRIKAILDGLNGNAWLDDDQVLEIVARRFDDKNDPRAVVTITPL